MLICARWHWVQIGAPSPEKQFPQPFDDMSNPSINRLTSRADGGMYLLGTRLPPTFLPSIVLRKKIATFSSAYCSIRERAGCLDQAGPRRPSVLSPSSVRHTISGLAIRHLSSC